MPAQRRLPPALLALFLVAAGCGDGTRGGADLSATLDMTAKCSGDSSCSGGRHCDPKSGACLACVTDDHCPSGQICKSSQCVAGCSASHGCGDAGACEVDAGTCFTCGSDGDCQDPTPRCDTASGRCVACLPQSDNCPAGDFCTLVNGAYQCSAGCKSDDECKSGDGGAPTSACCGNLCTDTATDNANCGACNNPCTNGASCCASVCLNLQSDLLNCGGCGKVCKRPNATASCTNGQCGVASCNAGFADCNGTPTDGCETNTQTDPNNCSACGMVCVIPHGTPKCASGTCQVASCDAGFADCNGTPADGCETPVDTLANCGTCGNACTVAGGTPKCGAGSCGIASCNAPFADCNGQYVDGCEIDTSMDPNNCDGCGMVCVLPNAVPACVNGTCAVASCTAPFADCDKDPRNGCEIDVTTNNQNCNGCGNACTVANGLGQCVPQNGVGQCVVAACTAPFADCNKQYVDGCETNTGSDPNNCNGCGMVCVTPNAVPGCSGGKCTITSCSSGFLDCNGDPSDGCEINGKTDPSHCGGCNTVCPNGTSCNNGSCGLAPYGNGSDGALTVGGGTTTIDSVLTTAVGVAGATSITLGNATGFAAGQTILLHQSQGSGAGNWELALVTGVSGNSATLLAPIKNTYQTVGNNHAQAIVVPQYTTASVAAGATLTAPAWNGSTGGILVFEASSSTSVDGSVDMSGRGYRGGGHACLYRCADGFAGEGELGPIVVQRLANGEGGGGGTGGQDCGEGGGGSYGAAGSAGPNGTVGTCSGNPHYGGSGGNVAGSLDLGGSILFGGAGGEGGADEDGSNPGPGGNGGGIVIVLSPTITVTGAIASDGATGGNGNQTGCGGSGCGMGGGGGGAGGGIRLASDSATIGASLVHAAGAGGGSCTCGGSAGSGGNGRIAIQGTVSGTTNPSFFGG